YPKTVTDALSHSTASKYDFNTGMVKEVSDPRGNLTTMTYDLFNRVTSVTEANGKQTTADYNDTDRIITKEVTVDDTGNKGRVRTYLDGLNRVFKTLTNDTELEIVKETEYDGDG